MRLADMDKTTKAVVVCASMMAKWPSNRALRMLKRAVEAHQQAHEEEMLGNLMKHLFPEQSAPTPGEQGGE